MVTVRSHPSAMVRVPPDEVHAELVVALDDALAALQELEDVEQVWLVGSTLHGGVHATSDLDLVVVRRTSADPVGRRLELAARLALEVPLDLFVYTPDEFARDERFLRYVRECGERLR